jgi:hypothetical protein
VKLASPVGSAGRAEVSIHRGDRKEFFAVSVGYGERTTLSGVRLRLGILVFHSVWAVCFS